MTVNVTDMNRPQLSARVVARALRYRVSALLAKLDRDPILYVIDVLTHRGVKGWAFSRGHGPLSVQVWVDGACIGEGIADGERSDVGTGHPDAPESGNSGFGIDFALPDTTEFADVTVRLLRRDRTGKVTKSIETVPVRLLTDAGRRAITSAVARQRPRSPFPRDVAAAVTALWPDAPIESNSTGDQLDIADKIVMLAAQPASEGLTPVIAYARYLRETWAHFNFVRDHFPRVNMNRKAADKDYSCTLNSPEELMTIAHHLFVLRSQGITGAFAEFGCYQGYSTAMLSYACRLLAIPMHVFDSFAGLPGSDSDFYRRGEFAGSLADVTAHVETYGAREMVAFHQGYFADTLSSFAMPDLITLWMDVDLEASARDVMTVIPRVHPSGAVFTHECLATYFEGDRVVAPRGPNMVIPVIVDAFERIAASARGCYLHGSTGAFWRREGFPVLGFPALQRLLDGV
jgi:hypothetical protein